jgi:hypothetical protein
VVDSLPSPTHHFFIKIMFFKKRVTVNVISVITFLTVNFLFFLLSFSSFEGGSFYKIGELHLLFRLLILSFYFLLVKQFEKSTEV